MKNNEQSDLQSGWAWATIGEVTENTIEKKAPEHGEEFLYVDISSIDNKAKKITEPKTLPVSKAPSRARQHLRPGDVLVSLVRPNLNAVAMLPEGMAGAIGSTGFHVLRTRWIPPHWLFYIVQTSAFIESMSNAVRGALYPAIRSSDVDSYKIPIAPLSEQRRIINEIEKQLSRLDVASAGFKRIESNLARFRSLTLKAASNGRLAQNENSLARQEKREFESADSLLARILRERRTKWEAAQLAKMEAQATKPQNDKWKEKYQEPVAPDISSLQDLPEGWTWATLDQLSWDASYGTSEKTDYGWTGTPVIRIPNVSGGNLDVSDLKLTAQPLPLKEGNSLAKGDFLIIRTNGSKDLLGRGALVRVTFDEPYYYASYLIRFRLISDSTIQEWLALQWDNLEVRESIESMAATTAGQYNIRLDGLKNVCVPLAPLAEQHRIINEFQRRQSILDDLERVAVTNLKRTELLKQKILRNAFEGNLVPQDPEDVPAEKLLESIALEKARLEIIRPTSTKKSLRKSSVARQTEAQLALPFSTNSLAPPAPSEQSRVRDMKLISLKIDGDYKSLHNFEQIFRNADIDNSALSPICLVGLNGSGKSNLIEALSEILCYLEIINLPYEKISSNFRKSDLRFEIVYELPLKGSRSTRLIRVSKLDDAGPTFVESINGVETVLSDPTAQLEALPTRIIGYSSGLNETISIPFFRIKSFYSTEVAEQAKKVEQAKKQDINLPPVANTRTLFMDYDSNAAILLANYLFSSKKKLSVFRKYIRIADIDSFHITIQLVRPNGKPVLLTPELKQSIARLQTCATDTINQDDNKRFTFTYDVTPRTRKKFQDQFADAKSFFTAIYKLSLLNVLALTGSERRFFRRKDIKEGLLERPPTVPKEHKIFNIEQLQLKLVEPNRIIDYAGISDGEHQFIHVFGTVKLFDEPGCLFLLDEPETHFNPFWRREFIQTLEDIPMSRKQEFVISTHSPFIVSGCRQENVFKFERKGGTISHDRVDFETYGSSFDYLLMKLFDLESLISEQAFDDLKEVIENDDQQELEAALGRFGESFEKRFLFEKIAQNKGKRK